MLLCALRPRVRLRLCLGSLGTALLSTVLLGTVLLGTAAAQGSTAPPTQLPSQWTVQVFAFSDPLAAAGVVAKLRAVGLDAYAEQPERSRLVQVRVGCFSAHGDAEGIAQDVRRRVASDALVVPFTPEAGATVCVRRTLGFIPPGAWGVAAQDGARVTFWLEAAGRRYLTFGGRWRVAQSAAELKDIKTSESLDGALEAHYRATTSRGLALVRADLAGGSLIVSAGELLWSSARAAVVRSGDDIFSLSLVTP